MVAVKSASWDINKNCLVKNESREIEIGRFQKIILF